MHNTKRLGMGRTLDRFAQITARHTGMLEEFTSMLDCGEIGAPPDGTVDQLPAPSQLGATRIGGIDINRPRLRAALAAVLALAVAPQGFTVAHFTARVLAMTGQTPEDYSTRRGGYDLRKLRGEQLIAKPGRTRRYHVPGGAARTIAAILAIRGHVVAPLIAGVRTPRRGRPPKPCGPTSTATTRPSDYARRPYSAISASPPPPPIDNILSITPGKPLGSRG